MPTSKSAWMNAWQQRNFRIQFIVSLLLLVSFSGIFNWFFDYAESRMGVQLSDPLLDILPVHNVSWVVFFFLYSGIALALFSNWNHPKALLLTLQTYILVTLVRILSITLFPLEPPAGYVPLREPIVQFFTNGGRIISKDLFFSGHVSTISTMYFGVTHKGRKSLLAFFVIMVGFLVLVQHVHYTIDVIFAPLFTWMCFVFNKKYLNSRIN
ncbi:MAG TPA: phosphatase PAP2-related protein [Bacteroidia bacterium]|nr:phosphatase PAP2-related protein [Bacteroidia bacterium]